MDFDNVFKITTVSLRLNGSHPAIVRNKAWLSQFIPIISMSIFCIALLLNSFLWYDLPNGKYAEASKNVAMAVVAFIIDFKYFILLYHQNSIKILIEDINSDYELTTGFSNEDKTVIINYAQRGVRVGKFWVVSAFGTCFIFVSKAILLMCWYYFKGEFQLVPMFDFTYPKFIEARKHQFPMFGFCFLFCLSFDCYAATMYLGFDPLIPIFMLHACGQLELLSRRMAKLFSEFNNLNDLERELRMIIVKLQNIYRFVDRIKSNFNFLYEFIMKSTCILLPLTAFQILEIYESTKYFSMAVLSYLQLKSTQSKQMYLRTWLKRSRIVRNNYIFFNTYYKNLRRKTITIEFTSFFSAVILHFYMPCYYSDVLMEKNEHFRQAIYACGWENLPDKRVRQIILFMLTRTSRPLGISTVFYNICLDTFSEMCRQSYRIFNLMNAVWV